MLYATLGKSLGVNPGVVVNIKRQVDAHNLRREDLMPGKDDGYKAILADVIETE